MSYEETQEDAPAIPPTPREARLDLVEQRLDNLETLFGRMIVNVAKITDYLLEERGVSR